jgi:protease-4
MGVYARHREYFNTKDGVQERYHSGAKSARNKIAIIDVSGVISSGEGATKKQIEQVRDDPYVKAVVLRVDSPGGTITGSDYIYHHLCELKKEREIPLVVSMGGIAASGGYYVAMAVGDQPRSIFAEPTTTTGSIGVIVPHYDLSGLLERLAVKDDSIVSHPRKQLLSMTKPITPDDREVLEGYMEEAFDRFKEIVKSGRPAFRENEDALEELATGEIFSAVRAQRLGLVDEIGFVEQAIERAAELAGLDPETTRVVEYRTPITLWDLLASAQAGEARGMNWQSVLELGVPRAYYLMTSVPALAVRP